MTTTSAGLPAEFADLAPHLDWALQGERARYQKRLASSMQEMQAFYDAAFARFDDVVAYLEQRSIDDLTDEEKNLLWMYCSLVNVSFPIEVWRQQRVPDSGASDIIPIVEPAI